MRSVGATLTRQFLRRDGWLVLFAWANYFIWIPLIVRSNHTFASEYDYRPVHTVVFWSQVLFSAVVASFVFSDRDPKRSGFPHRLFLLPVSTRKLVAWQMGLAVGSATLLYLVLARLLDLWLGVKSPLWEPSVMMALCVAISLALTWTLAEFRFLRILAFFAAIFPLAFWSYRWAFRRQDFLLAAFGLGAAYVWALAAVRAHRRGDGLRPLHPLEWMGDLDARGSAAEDAKPFASPAQAQYDYEWSRKGYIMPTVVGAIYLLILTAGILFEAFDGNDMLEIGLLVAGLALTFGAFLNGLVLGHMRPFSREAQIGTFLATRPVPDRFLSAAVLKTAAASWLATLLVSVVAALLCASLVVVGRQGRLLEEAADLLDPLSSAPMWLFPAVVCAAVLVGLGLGGLGASLMLTGRQKLVSRFGFGLLVLYIALMASTDRLEKRPWGEAVLMAILFAGNGACLFASIRAFVAAFRRGHIGWRTLAAAAGVWVFISVLAAWTLLPEKVSHGEFAIIFALVSGFASLVPAPLAFAPLALAWNRHR